MHSTSSPSSECLFSLIIATFGKAEGLERCLESLLHQTLQNFEVLIVDQNEDDRLESIIAPYAEVLRVRHLRSGRGVSVARNRGIEEARGIFVAFPDDDCWYASDLLERVQAYFVGHEDIVGLTGRCVDISGRASAGATDRQCGLVSKSNIWQRAVSAAIFIRVDAVRRVGGFDETLGLGAATIFQSGEETDLLLRIIGSGEKIYFDPGVTVFHPLSSEPLGEAAMLRAWQYGLGMGRVLRKHEYSASSVGYHFLYPFLGSVVAFLCGRFALSRLRFARTLGRIKGW